MKISSRVANMITEDIIANENLLTETRQYLKSNAISKTHKKQFKKDKIKLKASIATYKTVLNMIEAERDDFNETT